MRRLLVVLALIALVGCSQQPEYGPKAEPRYTLTWEGSHPNSWLRTIRDTQTGEEWLVYNGSGFVAVLRHTGGTDDRR